MAPVRFQPRMSFPLLRPIPFDSVPSGVDPLLSRALDAVWRDLAPLRARKPFESPIFLWVLRVPAARYVFKKNPKFLCFLNLFGFEV